MTNIKQCPYCSNEILSTAQKCKHCHEWLNFECPYCAELISNSSEQCPHCKSTLKTVQQNKPAVHTKKVTEVNEPPFGVNNWPFFIFRAILFIIALICIFALPDFGIGMVLAGFIFYFIYFLPTEIADNKKHPNTTAIFVINLFFGLTVIGWVAALIWAVLKVDKVKVEIN